MERATQTPSAPARKIDPLAAAAEKLRVALAADIGGNERDWANTVGDAFAQLEIMLRKHRASGKDPNGLFAEVDENRETLMREADRLRASHDEFLTQLRMFREEMSAANAASGRGPAPRTADLRAVRQLGNQFLDNLAMTLTAETGLLIESVNSDIGTGD